MGELENKTGRPNNQLLIENVFSYKGLLGFVALMESEAWKVSSEGLPKRPLREGRGPLPMLKS